MNFNVLQSRVFAQAVPHFFCIDATDVRFIYIYRTVTCTQDTYISVNDKLQSAKMSSGVVEFPYQRLHAEPVRSYPGSSDWPNKVALLCSTALHGH